MKRYFLATLVIFGFAGAQAQQFTLNGTAKPGTTSQIKLYYAGPDGRQKVDSAKVVNGKFAFKGELNEPTMAYLSGAGPRAGMDDPRAMSLFLEPTAMTIDLPAANYKTAKVTGSASQDEYAQLSAEKAAIWKETEPLSKEFAAANKELQAAIKAKKDDVVVDKLREKGAAIHDKFEPYSARAAAVDYKFFESHPTSYVTATELRYHISSMPLDSAKYYYSRLGEKVQQSAAGKNIAEEIEKLQAGSPGSMAKDFTTTELNGSTLTLSSFKGKYVLIDFWASWCVPCRKSMPHVKELYEKYKSKGFDVIAVSDDDRDSTAWKKAMTKDGTGLWHNVLRGLDWDKINRGEKNEKDISEKFGIHSLPTKILIDPDGKIIGRYDKGTEEEAAQLDKKLEEVMAKALS